VYPPRHNGPLSGGSGRDALDKLEARARNDLHSHITNWRVALPMYLVALGLFFTSLMDGILFYWFGVPLLLAAGIAFLSAQQISDRSLDRVRAHVRRHLLDNGLLLLLLEPDPYGRLPSLRRGRGLNAKLAHAEASGSFRERLERAVESYRGCCRDLGLKVPAWAGPLLPIAVRLELADLLRGQD
jgi:hypothetical protein